jgi:hypothetical protein
MSDSSRVIYQEVPRDFRTEIPNIVFELLEAGEISPNDLILYSVYRRIAGEHGACWVGTRGLEKKTKLSHPTIKKSKNNLSRKFDMLGGKSLIEITPCNRKKEQADTITIIDIWPENYAFFKKRLTCENSGHTGVKKEGTRVCKDTVQKNEQSKKEPYKEVSKKPIVHNSTESKPQSTPSSINSIPFSQKVEQQFSIDVSSPEVIEILEMEDTYKEFFRPKVVSTWIKKFGPTMTLEMIKYFFKIKSTQKKPIETPEKWMERAFQRKYTEVAKTCEKNKQFAENLKKNYSLRNLKINKRYCQDLELSKDYYYNLPEKVFKESLCQIYGIRIH